MQKYYAEEMTKDIPQRAEFVESIHSFLQTSQACAEKDRIHFITPEKYKNDPEMYREKFLDMLGFPLREKREMPTLEKTFVARDKNVDIFRLQFVFPNGLRYYGLYFRQVEDFENKPFLFGFHGGEGTPELVSSIHLNSSNYNHLIRRLTDKGASVFVPQLLLWNINNYGNPYDRLEVDGRLRQLGGSITAFEIWLMQGALDYFLANEGVNADKVGVAGMSYGGMYALHFAAADPRVKACYSCSWVCNIFKWARIDWCYANAQNSFAVAETAALIAPRPLVAAMGVDDEFYAHGADAECAKIAPYYEAFGKAENFKYVAFEGRHEVDKSDEEMDFLLNALK